MADDYTYRNLIMWNRAQQPALGVMKIVQRLPDTWGNAIIARQIIASATSIGANIAERYARYTPGAHRNHLSIAKGSTAETDSRLDLLHRAGYLSVAEEARLHTECREIMAMLTSKIRKPGNAVLSRASATHEEQASYIADIACHPESSPPFPFLPEDYQPGAGE
ncbi:MAG: four helix bundle protein [Roseiflexus sp.]